MHAVASVWQSQQHNSTLQFISILGQPHYSDKEELFMHKSHSLNANNKVYTFGD